jgi:uncharacterized membrane protein
MILLIISYYLIYTIVLRIELGQVKRNKNVKQCDKLFILVPLFKQFLVNIILFLILLYLSCLSNRHKRKVT